MNKKDRAIIRILNLSPDDSRSVSDYLLQMTKSVDVVEKLKGFADSIVEYSDYIEVIKEEASMLEAKLIDGAASADDKRELKKLAKELPNTPSSQVEYALRKLHKLIEDK